MPPKTSTEQDSSVSYAPETLKRFNPAYIYEFEGEASTNFRPNHTATCMIYMLGQFVDLYQAYAYAENTILSEIERLGKNNLTAEQLLEWIHHIHASCARTVAKGVGVVAGEYTGAQIFRSQPNANFTSVLMPIIHYAITEKKSLKDLDKDSFRGFKWADEMLEPAWVLLPILDRVITELDVTIPSETLRQFEEDEPSLRAAKRVMFKLVEAYHENLLTEDEKERMDPILEICMRPTQIPIAMKTFADELVKRLIQCNGSQAEVAAIAAFIFSRLFTIHPYFNVNKRTARCFMNTIIASFGYKTILLSENREHDDPESSYCRAIGLMRKDTSLLQTHIEEKLSKAQTAQPSETHPRAAWVMDRVKVVSVLSCVKNEFPEYPIDKVFREHLNLHHFFTELRLKGESAPDTQQVPRNPMEFLLKRFTEILETERRNKVVTLPARPLSPVVRAHYSKDDVVTIISHLERITGCSGWDKADGNTGLKIGLTLSNDPEAASIYRALSGVDGIQVQRTRKAGTAHPVIFVTNIQPKLLAGASSLKDATDTAATPSAIILQ